MSSGRRSAMASRPLDKFTLDNGLRVVVAPDRSAPVVGIAVHYDVGFRSEPPGRTGFAHLFEHLMFQGSESLPKLEHFRVVQSSGGSFNGSTHTDYTDYHQILPSSALERGLFLEADRMRAPRITPENLTNQVDVVSEEIRRNVLGRPYGGFPWISLPPVLFDSFANAHDGYGAFADLQAVTVADAADFFERYYPPANAVLTICGDVDADQITDLVEQYFGDVPSRPAPKRPSFAEPWPTRRRTAEQVDRWAPLPALALGWRVPDPGTDLAGYLAAMVAGMVLSTGEASRLQTALSQPGLVTSVWAGPGLMGGPLDARDPDVFVVGAVHPQHVTAQQIDDVVSAEIALLATQGPTSAEISAAATRFSAALFRENDRVGASARSLGSAELLFGRAELVAELPGLVAAISPAQVAAAAAALQPDICAELRLLPGAGS